MPTPPGPRSSSQNAVHARSTAGLSSRVSAGAQRTSVAGTSVAHAGAPSHPSAGSEPGGHASPGRAASDGPHASWWKSMTTYSPAPVRRAAVRRTRAR